MPPFRVMKKVGQACLQMLVLYAVLAAAVGIAAWQRTADAGAAVTAGLAGAVPLWIAAAYLMSIPGRIRDWTLMRRALRGAPMEDGKRTVAFGTLRPLRETLRSPFTNTPCVAYKYAVQVIGENDSGGSFDGFAMAPCAVHTRTGDVRLLAVPDFTSRPRAVRGREVTRNAQQFFEATTFTAATAPFNPPLDTHGGCRHDRALTAQPANFDHSHFQETILAPGEAVSVIGVYDASRRGLVPDPNVAFSTLVLKKGSESAIVAKAARAPFTGLIGATIFMAIFAVAGLWLLAAMPLDLSEQVRPSRFVWWPEVRLERWIEHDVRPRLAAMMGTPGTHLPELCDGCARGRIEILGEVIPLTTAVGREDAKEQVIEIRGSTARVIRTWNIAERRATLSVEKNGRTFVVPGEWLSPLDVQTFGGSGRDVHGRITILAPDDSIRCRVYFAVTMR